MMIEGLKSSISVICRSVRPTNLGDPLLRAARSIPLNIAEGVCRDGGDVLRHLLIVRGSAAECAAVLDILAVLDLLGEEMIARGRHLLRKIEKHSGLSF